MVKNLPVNAGDIRDEGSVLGSGRSPGEQSLVGYNPKGHKELDMIEATEHACTHAQVAVFLLPTS